MTAGRDAGVGADPARTAATLRRAGLLMLLGAALAGCVERGDFGRPRASLWNDTVLPFAGLVAAASREEAVSYAIFTDDETELRDRAWRFLMPAHERTFFQAQVAELARTRILPRMARITGDDTYFNAVRGSREASPAPLFRRIGEDAAADRKLVPAFVDLAGRVLESDVARLKLLVYVKNLEESQVQNAVARVAENRCLIAWVYAEAQGRAVRYRYALERLSIEAPQGEAAYAERELLALEYDIHQFKVLGIPSLKQERCEVGAFVTAGNANAPAGAPAPLVVKK
ncbi:MAG TPA: hypothetical protein VLQ65_15110 [Saliniramus sp.]|nr:hypothetical protein [Saliniramus sp.]